MNHSLKKHIRYWILPSLLVGLSMIIYFFDLLGLSFVIAPNFNREFGLIENIQLALLLYFVWICFSNLRKVKRTFTKILLALLLVGGVFMVLEEVDYGAHYREFLSGKSYEELKVEANRPNPGNFHNHGKRTIYLKLIAYCSLLLFFIVLPLVQRWKPFGSSFFRNILPSIYFTYTIVAMTLLNRIALYIEDNVREKHIDALVNNISEFEEVFIYYIAVLYLKEKMPILRKWDKEGIEKKNNKAL